MNKRSSFVPFIIGIMLGILAAVYLPGYVRPYLPLWPLGKATVVTGTVTAKQRKDRTLLLAVNTQQGLMLVTITQKADEVDLLVGEGTTIDLALKTYGPFVEDPRIIRVMKAAPSPDPAKAGTPAAAAGPSPGEKGPRDEKQKPSRSSVTASTPSKTSPPSKLPPAK